MKTSKKEKGGGREKLDLGATEQWAAEAVEGLCSALESGVPLPRPVRLITTERNRGTDADWVGAGCLSFFGTLNLAREGFNRL